jgi:hypothetical protein
MPTLRLEEVLKEHTITPELAVYVERLRAKGTTFDKLDADTASDLRVIAEALKISVFDIFVPAEKLYRLKIIEYIGNRYSGNLKQQLEALQLDLPESKKISLTLLGIYATQVLPESLLKGADLKEICKILGTNLEFIKELSDQSRQTISVETILKKSGISLDELAILMEIPKKFIPWISSEPIRIQTPSNEENIFFLENDNIGGQVFSFIDPCPVLCPILERCPKPCR